MHRSAKIAIVSFLLLLPIALGGQVIQIFPETLSQIVNSYPIATILGNSDQFYVRQGGTSKQVTFSTLQSSVGGGGGGGTGTVTSVAMSVPSGIGVTGSPITTNGTLGLSWAGTIPPSSLPTPTPTTIGGVESLTCSAGQFVNVISSTPGCATPSGGGTVTTSGTMTSGDCVKSLGTTVIADAGAPCGSGGGTSSFQTVSGTAPQSFTVTGDYVFMQTTAGTNTATLPSSPTVGQVVTFVLKNSISGVIVQSAAANVVLLESSSVNTDASGNSYIFGPATTSNGVTRNLFISISWDGTNWQAVAGAN